MNSGPSQQHAALDNSVSDGMFGGQCVRGRWGTSLARVITCSTPNRLWAEKFPSQSLQNQLIKRTNLNNYSHIFIRYAL